MTQLEINKKIAELKGLKMEEAPNLSQSALFFVGSDRHESESYKDWAKDISDAWELFEEIPGAVISKDDDNEDGCNSYYCRSATDNLSIYGATATEAICLAWIKWKEGS